MLHTSHYTPSLFASYNPGGYDQFLQRSGKGAKRAAVRKLKKAEKKIAKARQLAGGAKPVSAPAQKKSPAGNGFGLFKPKPAPAPVPVRQAVAQKVAELRAVRGATPAPVVKQPLPPAPVTNKSESKPGPPVPLPSTLPLPGTTTPNFINPPVIPPAPVPPSIPEAVAGTGNSTGSAAASPPVVTPAENEFRRSWELPVLPEEAETPGVEETPETPEEAPLQATGEENQEPTEPRQEKIATLDTTGRKETKAALDKPKDPDEKSKSEAIKIAIGFTVVVLGVIGIAVFAARAAHAPEKNW